MDKKVTIYNYLKQPVEIIIPNFENAKSAFCSVITGDEVLTIVYNDNSSKVFDSYPSGRASNYLDDEVIIPLDQLDELKDYPNSYNMLEHFGEKEIRDKATNEVLSKILEEKF